MRDEELLSPHPYESRTAWCAARVAETEARLDAIPSDVQIVLVNHFPLRREHAVLPRIPRFSIWCGTRRPKRGTRAIGCDTVVYGHLHIRGTRAIGHVRFEEVSLGTRSSGTCVVGSLGI